MTTQYIFKKGDLVKSKVGGPIMSIEDPDTKLKTPIKCKWWDDKDRKWMHEYFHPEELVLHTA